MVKEFKTGSRVKMYYFTRDVSIVGAQQITAIGFKPKVVWIKATVAGSSRMSDGFDDGSGVGIGCIYDDSPNGAGTYNYQPYSIWLVSGVGVYTNGYISSMNPDGFTITWAKAGAPVGVADILALCME